MSEKDFEQLFRDYFNQLLNFAYNMVKDEEIARDIVQQVFLNVWNKREAIKIRTSYQGYLYRSVYNSSLNHLRLKSRFVRISNDSDIESQSDWHEQEGKIIEDERIKRLQIAIDKLPVKCRAVFTLNRFENMTYKEVATHLGISVKMVEKQIAKALKFLRAELLSVKTNLFIIVLFYLIFLG
jgi:RNA polymerase sigma-70 factor, ECF subfamily